MDVPPADPPAAAARLWVSLDGPWQEAFRQAWEALRTGNIAVGACASTPDGQIVYAARNRVTDGDGPPGEIFGSSLAHAEMNVLARLPFRRYRDLVLTTTLQPCLQCAGAIRVGPIATVRFAGPDRYWDGCHDFGKLSAREARRGQPVRIGPCRDELGAFATLISRFGPTLVSEFEPALLALGEGPLVDLVHQMEDGGELERLAAMEVNEALGYLWPRLRELTKLLPASLSSRTGRGPTGPESAQDHGVRHGSVKVLHLEVEVPCLAPHAPPASRATSSRRRPAPPVRRLDGGTPPHSLCPATHGPMLADVRRGQIVGGCA